MHISIRSLLLAALLIHLPCSAKKADKQASLQKSVRILLVRHGEKTPKNAFPKKDLRPNNIGVMRAWALVPYMQTYAPTIDAIYAAPQGLDDEHSYRPMEICGNIAATRNIPINGLEGGKLIAVDKAEELAANIKANLKDGQTALVCWEHLQIPRIAKALGVSKLPKWDSWDYSHVWDIRITKGKAKLTHTHEKLPNQFSIPTSAFSKEPITILKSTYPLQYTQLLNFCPVSTQNAAQHQCQIDWTTQVHCCDHILYNKAHTAAKGCNVTLDQCATWYGITGWDG